MDTMVVDPRFSKDALPKALLPARYSTHPVPLRKLRILIILIGKGMRGRSQPNNGLSRQQIPF